MITQTRRILSVPVLGALIATVLVAPQAQAAVTEVDTWNELSAAFAAGGHITVGANIAGAGITASATTPVTLDLNGYDVTLTGGPALRIEGGANVTLQDATGGGSLTAIGTDVTAAAIGTVAGGTSSSVTAGTLSIDGANVTAQMDIETSTRVNQLGATVGGGDRVDGLTLTVQSGSLTAHSVDRTYAAAIGGGNQANSGPITINGGTVTTTSGVDDEVYNVTDGAAIGGGFSGTADITINDGVITATSNGGGAAIGSGYPADAGSIRINGGEVTAITNATGAAIGGGHRGNGGTITLAGGTVRATSTSYAAAIGGGSDGTGGAITVTGGAVHALGQSFGSAIGGGSRGDGGNITILGGDVTATNESFGASIGGGSGGKGGDVVIADGTVTAHNTGSGAGIGGGFTGPGGAVTISGGVLDISARSNASAVGAGSFGPTAPPRPADELGSLQILGTALGGSVTAVTGRQASPLEVVAPTSPIRFVLNNGPVSDQTNLLRTTITFGHSVSFDAKGGAPKPSDQFIAVGDRATAPTAPTRNGHIFTGWFNGAAKYNFNSPVRSDLKLTAGWDCSPCAVTFDSKGGSKVAAQSVARGGKATTPSAPTRAGYVFKGWTNAGSQYDFKRAVTTPLTLTASWAKSVNLVDVSSNKNSKHYTQFHREIQWLADSGITRGWSVGGGKHEFRPKDNITREAMAAFMYRYAGSPAVKLPATSPFKDVTPSNTNFYKEIVWMNQQGISTGWAVSGGNKEFRPKDDITRDAMAAFMYRFAGKPKTTPPTSSPFADVPKSSQFYKEITWLSNAGISTGWTQPKGKPQYRPFDQISREAMAAFLYRLDRL